MEKRILITTGGTGGHVYPAIALAEKLRDLNSQVYFIGGRLSTNPYFSKNSFPFKEVSCGMWGRKGGAWRILREMGNICLGIKESYHFLKEYQPDLIVGFGSYYTFPVLCAARLFGIPYALHEANAVPGKVIKLFSSQALFTGVHFPSASQYLRGQVVNVSLPVRKGFIKQHFPQEMARESVSLHPTKKTCLIFGGSQGAEALNHVVLKALDIVNKNALQFWHITGNGDTVDSIRLRYAEQQIQAYVTPYETRMDMAWSAADFALTRAGAGTIAEAMAFEAPLILVPYPQAADQHQDKNADFVVEKVNAGVKIQQADLNFVKLGTLLNTLADGPKLNEWKENIRNHNQQTKAKELHHLIVHHFEEK